GGELMSHPWARLSGDQPRQPTLLEIETRLIEGRPRKPKAGRSLANCKLVHFDPPQHLVLDLHQIIRIEELAFLKKWIRYALRMQIQAPLPPEGIALRWVWPLFGHVPLC